MSQIDIVTHYDSSFELPVIHSFAGISGVFLKIIPKKSQLAEGKMQLLILTMNKSWTEKSQNVSFIKYITNLYKTLLDERQMCYILHQYFSNGDWG